MISKVFKFIKTKFITIAFVSFAIIGVINTAIDAVANYGILELCDQVFFRNAMIKENRGEFPYIFSIVLAKSIAFTLASLFSYFANAKFTFKVKEKSQKQFLAVFLTYGVRLLCSILLNLLFVKLFGLIVSTTFFDKWWKVIPNLASSIILIPVFFIILGVVFKKTDKKEIDANQELQ